MEIDRSEEFYVNIDSDAYYKDFDEIGFDPIVIDDNDEEAAELYNY